MNKRHSIVIFFFCSSFWSFSQLPLMQFSDLEYQGAFIVPADDFGGSSSNYSAGTFTLSSDREGFFLAGHNVQGAIAEFEIPDIVNSDSLDNLNYATIRQNFKSLMNLTPDGNPQFMDRISGMKVIDGQLFVNTLEYYDAPADNTLTTFVVEDANNLAGSTLSGYYKVEGRAHAAGWISNVPNEWQSRLGGDYIMGNSSKYPINSRSAMGVSAFVFDPADLANNTTDLIPSTKLLDYDLANPLYSDFGSYANAHYNLTVINGSTGSGHTFEDADAVVGENALWTSSSQASFGFIVPGTRTYMSVGSSGGHNSGIGYKATQNNGNLCGGPCSYDAEDVYNFYWLWDLDDLVNVKNGAMEPYDVRPYDSGEFTVPFQYDDYYSVPEFHEIIGGDFDADKGILYLTLHDGGATGSPYRKNPVIVAYKILSSGVAKEPIIRFDLFKSGFDHPIKITHAGDGSDRLFVAETNGKIKIVDTNDTELIIPFIDVSPLLNISNDNGLLGLAFHPDYSINGFFYIQYVNPIGNINVARFKVSSTDMNEADMASEQLIFSYDLSSGDHIAGDINFGPEDGYLYIAAADGSTSNTSNCLSQDSTSAKGKLLRIDVDVPIGSSMSYLIPPTNPLFGMSNMEEAIWAFGLRSPNKFSFDRDGGDLWLTDVGENLFEEVNFNPSPLTGAINYGWTILEGTECIPTNENDPDCNSNFPDCLSESYQVPLFQYSHEMSFGGDSIVGGVVYRGCKLSALQGLYICADYNSGNVWTVDQTGSKKLHNAIQSNITTFGENEQGELYCANAQGEIYRITDTVIPEILTLTASDSPLNGRYEAYNNIIVEEGVVIPVGNQVYLIAPEVKINDQVITGNYGDLIIKSNGCK